MSVGLKSGLFLSLSHWLEWQRERWMKNNKKCFLGSYALALLVHHSGAPDGALCAIWGPWDPSREIPLATYLNRLTIVTSWTWLRRVRSSRIRNLCLKGTPSSGWKSLVVLQPRLGVKRSEKGRAHVCIFPWIFLMIFFEALPKSWGFRPSDML